MLVLDLWLHNDSPQVTNTRDTIKYLFRQEGSAVWYPNKYVVSIFVKISWSCQPDAANESPLLLKSILEWKESRGSKGRGQGDMSPQRRVGLPLLHHQEMERAVGQGQVEQGGVGQELQNLAKDKTGKVGEAQRGIFSSIFKCRYKLHHYILTLAKFLLRPWGWFFTFSLGTCGGTVWWCFPHRLGKGDYNPWQDTLEAETCVVLNLLSAFPPT